MPAEKTDYRESAWLPGAELVIVTAGSHTGEPLDAEVAVTTKCELMIRLSVKTIWSLKLERHIAAYLSGRLAMASGVELGAGSVPRLLYTPAEVREIAYQAAGAGAGAVMALAPKVVMPTEDVQQAVETILTLAEAGEL